jgi:hypothetical protein
MTEQERGESEERRSAGLSFPHAALPGWLRKKTATVAADSASVANDHLEVRSPEGLTAWVASEELPHLAFENPVDEDVRDVQQAPTLVVATPVVPPLMARFDGSSRVPTSPAAAANTLTERNESLSADAPQVTPPLVRARVETTENGPPRRWVWLLVLSGLGGVGAITAYSLGSTDVVEPTSVAERTASRSSGQSPEPDLQDASSPVSPEVAVQPAGASDTQHAAVDTVDAPPQETKLVEARPAQPEPPEVSGISPSAVRQLVEDWRGAQQARCLNDFSAFYAENFSGVEISNRGERLYDKAAWFAARETLLADSTTLTLRDLVITPRGASSVVSFVMMQASGTYEELASVRIELERAEGRLVIVREEVTLRPSGPPTGGPERKPARPIATQQPRGRRDERATVIKGAVPARVPTKGPRSARGR